MEDLFFSKVLAIFFSLSILGVAWFVARANRTWLLPSVIFSFFWFLYTFLPLVFLFNVPIHPETVLYILVYCCAFHASSFLFNWRDAKKIFYTNKVVTKEISKFNSLFINRCFYSIQAFVIFTIFMDIILQGFSLKSIIFDLMATSSSYINLRYSGDLNESMLTRVGTVFTYVGAILGGFVFYFQNKKISLTVTLIIMLIPSTLLMVVQGAKGAVFLCMFLFYGSLLVCNFYKMKTTLTDSRINKLLFYSVIILIPAIVSSFLSRGLYDQDMSFVIDKLKMYFYSYAFAHLYAFSDWFGALIGYNSTMDYDLNIDLHYGFYTFMAPFRLFGVNEYVPPGVYEEYFYYKNVLKSNIYTMFRGVILDYGIIGSLIFSFIFGIMANGVYFLMHVMKKPYLMVSIYICLFGFYYTSFIISIFIWNSLFVTIIVLYFILKFNSVKLNKTR